MTADFPEVEKMTRVLNNPGPVMLRYEEKSYEEHNIFFVEKNFFDMFSIDLIKGTPETIFATPNSMVMTEDTAIRENRLALLSRLNKLFLGVADISRLQS